MFLVLHKIAGKYTSECIQPAYENWQVRILDKKLTFHWGN